MPKKEGTMAVSWCKVCGNTQRYPTGLPATDCPNCRAKDSFTTDPEEAIGCLRTDAYKTRNAAATAQNQLDHLRTWTQLRSCEQIAEAQALKERLRVAEEEITRLKAIVLETDQSNRAAGLIVEELLSSLTPKEGNSNLPQFILALQRHLKRDLPPLTHIQARGYEAPFGYGARIVSTDKVRS